MARVTFRCGRCGAVLYIARGSDNTRDIHSIVRLYKYCPYCGAEIVPAIKRVEFRVKPRGDGHGRG